MIADLWTRPDPSNPRKRIPTARHGKGARWAVRYAGPDGRERADHLEHVRVDQEVLAQVVAGPDLVLAQAPQARLGRLAATRAAFKRRAHHPKSSCALASTEASSN